MAIIADHNSIKLYRIPLPWVNKAKNELHIAYGHTSHGSQMTDGLLGLSRFRGKPFVYKRGITYIFRNITPLFLKGTPKGSLDLRDNPFGEEMDLGNPDNKLWAVKTSKFLKSNKKINVVMWSWCGQLSKQNSTYIDNYLDLMQELEIQFPGVTFVYMTGHLDGSGESGNLALNNKHIREFCINNSKVLYDFADIESYSPDGEYFGDRHANDACEFDSDGDCKPDKNWAKEWQKNHKRNREWYGCQAAHTEPVNANMKACAMWWLLARIAGWNGEN